MAKSKIGSKVRIAFGENGDTILSGLVTRKRRGKFRGKNIYDVRFNQGGYGTFDEGEFR